jgi:hypothetical protein
VASLDTFGSEKNLGAILDASGSWSTEGPVTYDYDVNGDGSYDILAGQSVEDYVFPSSGDFTVILRVTDKSGNSATDTATARPVDESGTGSGGDPDDLAPVVKLQAYWAEGGEQYRTIDAQSSWARTGDDISYDYDMNDDGTFEILDGEAVFVHRFAGQGSYRIWLRVTDESGNSGSTSLVVEIGEIPAGTGSGPDGGGPVGGGTDEGGPPIAKLNIYWAEGGNAFRTLDAASSWALDGSDLIYDYDIDGDGTYEIRGGQQTMVYEYPAPGEYTTVLRVTDSSGNSATDSVTETIVAPDPDAWDPSDLAPVVKLQAYWAEGGNEFRTIDAQSSWARTGDELSYDYDMNDDGVFEIRDGESVFVHRFPGPGTYRIWLRVADESGNSGTTSILVEV